MGLSRDLAGILIQRGVIDDTQKVKAEQAARRNKWTFAEALMKEGLASEEVIASALAEQFGLPFASDSNRLLRVETDQGLDKLVPEDFARKNLTVPLFREGNILAVAFADPENLGVAEVLQMTTKLQIEPFVAARSQILRQIDTLYGSRAGFIEQALDAPKSPGPAGAASRETVDLAVGTIDLDKASPASGAPMAIQLVNAILKQAVSERASDIHLEIFDDQPILRFRIDGMLYERTPPPRDLFLTLVSRLKIVARLDIAERRLPQDGAFSIKLQDRPIDIRMSTCPAAFGEKVVLRLLDKGAVQFDLDKIGLEPRQRDHFLEAARLPHGMIFLTGPTGSGKTSTLYALLNAIKTPSLNFLTIEDPVEIKMKGLTQVEVKPNIGLTFAAALRSFLRQDPDILLVGEVRDEETAEICIRAALTGHMVLSTLHTNDAMGCTPRLLDLGAEPFLLSSCLELVAAQRLIRVLCTSCREAYAPDENLMAQVLKESRIPASELPPNLSFYRPKGCPRCHSTGFQGRIGIYEVYRLLPEMKEIIARGKAEAHRLQDVALRNGMWNLRTSGWLKVLRGITSVEEVLTNT
ncbi:MAG: ATPase, T2SS/T4P/T4SS family [Elusimicrobia bacterium]|nr:ATPase, T2SS/T4P/T4SS family [Elusimicrobiota bacterium]